MHAHEQERFILRFTQDLYVIRTGPTLESVVPPYHRDHKVHVWDRQTGTVVWQNCPSVRYGDAGVVA